MESRDDLLDDDALKTFENAAVYVRTVGARLDSSKLLFFYGRFKQAKEGPCNVPKPGFFDFQGKQKWEAWRCLGNMSKEQAMAEYVAAVTDLDSSWTKTVCAGEDVKGGPGGWVTVSTMLEPEENRMSDEDKTVFDWCKEGNLAAVQRCISGGRTSVDSKDDSGLALLHWAADRGHCDIAKCLIARGADVNCTDMDGQTPLHYACSCEHVELVRLLLANGCDVALHDNDGQLAASNATSREIRLLLANST